MQDTHTHADNLATRLLCSSLAGATDDCRTMISTLDVDELQDALVALLGRVDEFVRRLAERHAVSERAVLRSMGIEPERA